MDHNFNVKIAELYGVDEAIMLNNLVFWQLKNEANNKHEHNGRFWTYNSMKAFAKLFPYWTEKQIRRILVSLEEKHCIKSGNFNKAAYDRTKWYSVEPLILDICLNGQMDFTKRADGFDQTVEPIPYNKPNNKNIYIVEIIDYLNQKTGKSFKHSTDKTTSCLNARWNEGFKDLQDYKFVIDLKCSEWIKNKDMEKYLRPETLFGTKFESYVNEKSKNKISAPELRWAE